MTENTVSVTDKRFWAKDESLLERAPAPEKKYPSFVEELKARTERAEQALKEKLAQLERENAAFRARSQHEVERRVESERARLVGDFLQIYDNLEKALQTRADPEDLRTGLQLTADVFLTKLKNLGLEIVDPLGKQFDPASSEALLATPVDNDSDDDKVLEVVSKGFSLNGKLIRPAKVRVGKRP